jgi:hypothetical protein
VLKRPEWSPQIVILVFEVNYETHKKVEGATIQGLRVEAVSWKGDYTG